MALLVEDWTKSGRQRVLRGVYSEKELKFSACQVTKDIISSRPKSLDVDDQSSIALLSPKTEFLARNLWIVFF